MTVMKDPKTLKEAGYTLYDIVALNDVQKSSGGVLYKIVEDVPPTKPATTEKKVMRQPSVWDAKTGRYVKNGPKREETQYGSWDKDGNKLLEAARFGYVRIKPVFELFATSKGKNPQGKNGTLLITYEELPYNVKRIDIVDLGTKYVEFGNLIKDLASRHGSNDE